jgi:long-chain fatty acid transport protein
MNPIKVGAIPSAILISLLSHQAIGSGFAVIEHSASGMGNAFAGAAAIAEDASTAWFNPAGLTRFKEPQLVLSGHVIIPTADFTDKGSFVNAALTGGTVVPGSLRGSNDDGGAVGIVPNLYYTRALNDTTWFGFSLNAPFGLATDYKSDWVGRYHALESAVAALNINPSLAWRINDKLSFGAGISAQYITVTLSNAIDSAAACLSIAATNPLLAAACTQAGVGVDGNGVPLAGNLATDSKANIEDADDWSFGFNFGFMYEPSQATRIGFSYRSEIEQEPEGDVDFTLNPGFAAVLAGAGIPLFQDGAVSAGAALPASVSFSVAHTVNNKLQLLGDITWTGWSSFEELRIKFANPLQPDAFTDESWEDVFRYSIGANYQYNKDLILRAGLAFDEEAIPDESFRTPRIPGNDRTWISFGAGYKFREHIDLDFGFSHLFVADTPIDHINENGYGIRGVYEADVNILSSQLTWKF